MLSYAACRSMTMGGPGMQEKWNDVSIVVQGMPQGDTLHMTKSLVCVGKRSISKQFVSQHGGSRWD